MDLLAVATADRQVSVYRLTWQTPNLQQLWGVTLRASATSACWRPDGKTFFVGHSSGDITVLDVENGEILSCKSLHSCSVSSISCVEYRYPRSTDLASKDRSVLLFPAPPGPDISQDYTLSGAYESVLHGKAIRREWPTQRRDCMDVTASLDVSGRVMVCAGGTFALASFSLAELCGLHPSSLDEFPGLALTTDLQQMVVLAAETEQSGGRLMAFALGTGALAEQAAKLQDTASQAMHLSKLLGDSQEALDHGRVKWAEAMKQVEAMWSKLEKVLEDNGSASSPEHELRAFLACGMPSPGMRHFLSVTMGEGGTKRLAKTVDSAATQVHSLFAERVFPALEMVSFRLGELLGIARFGDWTQPVELEEGLLEEAVQATTDLMIRAKQLMCQVTAWGAAHRTFFLWILRSILQLQYGNMLKQMTWPSRSTEDVRAFLQSAPRSDPVGAELGCGAPAGCGGRADAAAAAKPALELPAQAEALYRAAFGREYGGRGGARPLRLCDGLAALAKRCDRLFASLPGRAASGVRLMASHHLAARSDVREVTCAEGEGQSAGECPSAVRVCFAVRSGDGARDVCCVLTAGLSRGTGVGSAWDELRVHEPGSRCEASLTSTAFAVPAGSSLECARFYKGGQLSLLLRSGEGPAHARFGIADLRSLPEQSFSGGADGPSLATRHIAEGQVHEDVGGMLRLRSCPDPAAENPLAVSGSRGVACLLTSKSKAVVFDLEDDEGNGSSSDDS